MFSVLIVGFSDDVLTARSFARRDERVHPNQELLALGAANVGASVLRGFPVAALGAIVIYAAVRLIDVTAFRRLLAFRRGELVVAVSACAAALLGGAAGTIVQDARSARW